MGLSATDRTCHCRGADSRARRGTADRYRLTLKQYAPIASVAALIERLAGWQHVPHGFYGVKPPDLSLRGGRRPTWQSREGSYVFAGSAQLSGQVLRDSHVALLLGMTRQASAAVHQCLSAVECSPYWAVTDRRYIFLSSGGLCRDRRCGRNRPIYPDRYSVHHAGTQPGHSDSFPAACFSCCFFRVFPA